MRHKSKLLMIIAAGILLSLNIKAQDKLKLTLEESIQIGLKNSNQIHSSKMKVKAAEAQLSQVNSMRLPSLSLSASYTRLSKVPPFSVSTPFGKFDISPSIYDNYTTKLSLQQPLFTGFKLSGNSDMAEYNSLATKQQYTKDEQDLIFNIKNAYWNLFKAKQMKKAVDDNVQQVQAHLEDIQNFYKQGLATKNQVLKVQVQLSEVKLNQIDAQNAVQLAVVNLDNVLGLALSTDLEIQDSVVVNKKNNMSDLDRLIKEAKENRADLKAMEYKLKASEKNITVAESDWYPQIYLVGNYNYSRPNQRLLPTQDKFYGTWDVSVAVSYNLWSWGSKIDKTDEAKAQYEQAKDGLKMMKDGVTLEVTSDYYNLVKAKQKVSVTEQAVNQAEENYRVTNDKFKEGMALNSDLLDAETALKMARTNKIQALVDYELAKAQIEKATGRK